MLHLRSLLSGTVIASLVFFAATACQSDTENSGFDMARQAETTADMDQQQSPDVERKLIKEGFAVFETASIDTTRKRLFTALDKYQGYVAADQTNSYSGRISNTVTIRVPAGNFDQLFDEVTRGIKNFESKNIELKDVTEEFVDVEARLKTKKELEARYLALLQQAGNVTEILEVEKQIGQLRADIESVEGRLKYLENKVALATLTLTFYEKVPDENQFAIHFKEGFRNGWDNLIWFFVGLVNIWPFLLLLIGLLIGFRSWRRRRKS